MKMNYRTIILAVLILAVGIAAAAQREGRKVSGTVLEGVSLQPLAGVPVQYEEFDSIQSTTTDEKGYFEFESGTSGVVIVSHPKLVTTYRAWPPVDGGTNLEIHLFDPATIVVTVRDAGTQSTLLADVAVLVEEAGSLVSLAAEVQGATAVIEDVPEGPAILTVVSRGYAPAWTLLAVGKGETHTVSMSLVPEAGVAGTVYDAEGKPVSGADVFVTYTDGAGGYGMLDGLIGGLPVTKDDGNFFLFGLIPNVPVAIQAVVGDEYSEAVTVTLQSGLMQSGVELTFK